MLPLASANAVATMSFPSATTGSQSSTGDKAKKVNSPGKNAIRKIAHRCPLRILLAEDNIVNQVSREGSIRRDHTEPLLVSVATHADTYSVLSFLLHSVSPLDSCL